jgi:hypothetical protein
MTSSLHQEIPRVLHHLLDHQLGGLLYAELRQLLHLLLLFLIEEVEVIDHHRLRDIVQVLTRVLPLPRVLIVIAPDHTVTESARESLFVFEEVGEPQDAEPLRLLLSRLVGGGYFLLLYRDYFS